MDKDLLQYIPGLRKRDLKAQEGFYNLTRSQVYYLCYRILQNEQDSLDILQETYITAFDKIATLQNDQAAYSWLCRIAANKSKNFLKKSRGITLSDDEYSLFENIEETDAGFLPEVYLESSEKRRMIIEIIDKLPEVQRLCIMMHYYNQMSIAEIAGELDCSENTVKSRLRLARETIKAGVLQHEHEGIKLYSAAPFLLLLLNEEAKSTIVTPGASATDLKAIVEFTKAATGTAKKTGLLAQIAAHKIAAYIVGAVVVASVATGTLVITQNGQSRNKDQEYATTEADFISNNPEMVLPSSSETTETEHPFYENNANAIKFTDPIFEQYVRRLIGKMSGDLSKKDIEDILQIRIWTSIALSISYSPYTDSESNNATFGTPIYNINKSNGETLYPASNEDLKYFSNLESLSISSEPWIWPVKNVEFVANMPNLKYLYIEDNPHDLSPLKNCKNLEFLAVGFNQISDLTPFEKLTKLKKIEILGLGWNDGDEEKINEIKNTILAYLPDVEITAYT